MPTLGWRCRRRPIRRRRSRRRCRTRSDRQPRAAQGLSQGADHRRDAERRLCRHLDGGVGAAPYAEGDRAEGVGRDQIGSRERLKDYPKVPTIAETLSGVYADTWMAVSAPPHTPKEIAQKVSDAIHQGFQTPDMRARILALEAEPRGSSPADRKSTRLNSS